MSDIDKRLEELAAIKGGREYVMTRVLIAALLRARKALAKGFSGMKGCGCSSIDTPYTCWRHAALADPELEELLR